MSFIKRITYSLIFSFAVSYVLAYSAIVIAYTQAATNAFIILFFCVSLLTFFVSPKLDHSSSKKISTELFISALIGFAIVIVLIIFSKYGISGPNLSIEKNNEIDTFNSFWVVWVIPAMLIVNIILDLIKNKSWKWSILGWNCLYYCGAYAIATALYYGMFIIYFIAGLGKGA